MSEDPRFRAGPTIWDRIKAIESRLSIIEGDRQTGILGTDQTIKGSHDRLDSLLGAGVASPDGTLVTSFNADLLDGNHASALNVDKVDGYDAADFAIAPVTCWVSDSGSQTISDSTVTAVDFDTDDEDSEGMHSTVTNTDQVVLPAGWGAVALWVAVSVSWASNTTGRRILRITNGAATEIEAMLSPAAAGVHTQTFSWPFTASGSDVLRARVWQNSGGNLDIDSMALRITRFR